MSLQASNVGFILPGPVVVVGIILLVSVFATQFGTELMLFTWVLAITVRYLPLSVQAQESVLHQYTPAIDDAAQSLGATAFERMRRIVIPIIQHGLITAWVLVFIDALKELPAALIFGVENPTLPMVIWEHANDETMEDAAPAAILLILATFPVLGFLLKKSIGSRKDKI
jgi:iron(III) transport system permease protein